MNFTMYNTYIHIYIYESNLYAVYKNHTVMYVNYIQTEEKGWYPMAEVFRGFKKV